MDGGIMIRRCLIGVLLLLTCFIGHEPKMSAAEGDGWISLFDGKSLRGWKASDDPRSFKVVDGLIIANGPRSHLFYVGDKPKADFKNFELEAEVLTRPGANSGIYFHTQYQRTGWPEKGFEVQINNTYQGEGDFRELKKTGSLYGIRNQYKTVVRDNEWFRMRIRVEGKQISVWVNDWLLVGVVEPKPPVLLGESRGRVIGHGTFALQSHDPGSKVLFRKIRVKPLLDTMESPKFDVPKADETYLRILQLQRDNFPVIDFHVHLKGGLTLEESLAESRRN